EKIYNPEEVKTPRVGGIIIWTSVVLTVLLSILSSELLAGFGIQDIEFISRNQTLIPFFSLLMGAGLGLLDDILQIFGTRQHLTIDIPMRIRIAFVLVLGAVDGLWCSLRLGYTSIDIPFTDIDIVLGYGFIFFVLFVVLSLCSSSVIDGIDGLAG